MFPLQDLEKITFLPQVLVLSSLHWHLHKSTVFLLCFRSCKVERALSYVIFTAVVTSPLGGESWEQVEGCIRWVCPDRTALLFPNSEGLVLGDQTWANAGPKACSTFHAPEGRWKSQEQTAKQPGNCWAFRTMVGPFSSCTNKIPVGPGDFMKSQRRPPGWPCGMRKGMDHWLHQMR